MLAAALAAAAACSSPEKKAEQSLKSVRSWAAVARLTGGLWLDGKVPTAYAKQTLQAAQEGVEQEVKSLESPDTPAPARAAVGTLREVGETAGRAARAADAGDRAGVTNGLDRLEHLAARLAAVDRQLSARER